MPLVSWCAVAPSVRVGIDLPDVLHAHRPSKLGWEICLLPITEGARRGKEKQLDKAEEADVRLLSHRTLGLTKCRTHFSRVLDCVWAVHSLEYVVCVTGLLGG